MVVRKGPRREIRLDEDHDRLLEEDLRRRQLTFEAWVREQIDRKVAGVALPAPQMDPEQRLRKVRELLAEFRERPLNVPDPETLRRELDEVACPDPNCHGLEAAGH